MKYWNFLAILWAVPYTILVIYLIIWSKGKSFKEVYITYLKAPKLIIYFAAYIYAIIAIIIPIIEPELFGWSILIIAIGATFIVPVSLILGNFFIGVAFLLYRFSSKMLIIND